MFDNHLCLFTNIYITVGVSCTVCYSCLLPFRVDHDQFIRKQAIEMERLKNPDSNLDPGDFEYYEFQGN